MNIVIGLGNPGTTYENTRHNIGFMVLDNLSEVMECPKFSISKKTQSEVCKTTNSIFIKPTTYMNESGLAVRATMDYYISDRDESSTDLKDVYVIHDDLDLPLGKYKIQYGIGPKVHNGLNSIYQHLGTKNFWHVRVGIDTREGDRTIPPQTYVLQKLSPTELEKFNIIKVELIKELMARLAR